MTGGLEWAGLDFWPQQGRSILHGDDDTNNVQRSPSSFHHLKKYLANSNLLHAALDVERNCWVMFVLISLSVCLPLPPLSSLAPSPCLRGGCLRQMSVLAQGGASGGQPQPFRATGSQIQRWQGCVPGGHQKGKTLKNKSQVACCRTATFWWQSALFIFVCRLFMHPRSFPTRRDSCCCDRRPKSLAGPSTTAPSLWCGEEAASSEGTARVHPHAPLCNMPACPHASLTLMVKRVVGFSTNFLRKKKKKSHPNLHCSDKGVLFISFFGLFFCHNLTL